jgi:hypothetical protein
MTITLHIATATDFDAINARYTDIGFVPSQAGELVVVAMLAGDIAGQGRVVPIDLRSGELGGIYVLQHYRGHGIAKRIVDFLIGHANLPVLYCLPFAELEDFYCSMGFASVKQHDQIPQQVLQKHQWCNATYDKPVLLLEKIAA